ncbi:MAG: hypothetical protein UHX00_00980 [Caryophanon sp.]|nr:hypothetical protein [Caryophanon sp.]
MKKLRYIALASSLFLLAACSDPEEVIVTSSLGDITKESFYDEMIAIAGPSMIEQVVTKMLLEDTYSVNDADVDQELEVLKQSYGDTFDQTLEANGMTEESLRQNIYFSLLRDTAVKESGKTFDELMYDLLQEHDVQVQDEALQDVLDKYTQSAEQ